MKAKDYLGQIKTLDIKIQQRIEERKEMREKISILLGIDYSKDRIQTMPTSGNKQIEDLVDLENSLYILIRKEADLKHKIIGEIQELDNPVYIDLLYKRYVKFNKLRDIAEDMGYAYYYVCTLHGEALNEFQDKVLNFS